MGCLFSWCRESSPEPSRRTVTDSSSNNSRTFTGRVPTPRQIDSIHREYLRNFDESCILAIRRPLRFKKAGLLSYAPTELIPTNTLVKFVPSAWQVNDHVLNLMENIKKEVILQHPCGNEHRDVESNFFGSVSYRHFDIIKIERVQNLYLWLMFQLKYYEVSMFNGKAYCNHSLLFHGTKFENVRSICMDNFNWRLRGKSLGNKYGQGVSFSPVASYSSHYTDKYTDKKGPKTMFRVKVLHDNICEGNKFMVLPPRGYDTSGKLGSTVIVKYDDYTFYPEYLITYNGEVPDKFKAAT